MKTAVSDALVAARAGSAPRAIVIGGSAGGVSALLRILPRLRPGLPAPVLVVLHLPPGRESALASVFNSHPGLPAKEAEDKEPLLPARVYFAPPGYHLLVERDARLSLSADEPVLFSRPSIDVLFESAADAFGPGLLGVVLSGASSDGARGLAAVVRHGGRAVVQTPASSEMPVMPLAALRACPRAEPLGCEEIARLANSLCFPDGR